MRIVVDTHVFVSACLGDGAPAEVVRMCIHGRVDPVIGAALYAEQEDVLGRQRLFRRSHLDEAEGHELLDIFLARCTWIRVYFGQRPDLADEGDNHLVELGIAAQAERIITGNTRHLATAELQFAAIRIVNPATFLSEWSR